ncbi:GntR family transcriptional regulator [Gracilibacillus marinus]|jgi:GntR family transcriptional regulator|uniref:GntR family transcriptional regulator n=1 Tax=Gracilibacillus marinus TaxID=630535 RepID=A0ABV8VSI5_9BACI
MIDKNSPLPIYYQLEQEIREQIQNGILKQGELLPSERMYTEKYNISRMTVRQAINNLAQEGLLVRMKGKGTFIAEQKIQHTLKGITSFSEEMEQKGKIPSSKIISLESVQANSQLAAKLHIEENSEVYQLKRIRMADNVPIAFEIAYIPKYLVGELRENDFTTSFYQYVEKNLQLPITHGDQEIESALANEEDQKYLKVTEGAPILLIRRLTYVNDQQPIEYVRTAYHGEKYKYKLTLPR